MAAELIFYTPLTGSVTATISADLQGDAAPPTYTDVSGFTSNLFALEVAGSNLSNLFTLDEATGQPTAIDTTIFTSLLSEGESDFFNSTLSNVTLGGFSVPSLYTLAANVVPDSFADIGSNRGLVAEAPITVSTTGDSFTTLFDQVNSNATFIQNFYNDALSISGAAAASAITFLVEYTVTKNYNYVITGSDYPAAPAGTFLYYDRVTGAPHSLTSLTDSSSGTVRFALQFNVAA
jgi:hypothetical protein